MLLYIILSYLSELTSKCFVYIIRLLGRCIKTRVKFKIDISTLLIVYNLNF